MAFQLSPGVNVSEVDLTTVVPSVLTTAGAIAGTFAWGPADKVILIDNELSLIDIFRKPDSNSAVSFFTASSFLSYGNNLSVVRSVGAAAFNATSNTAGIQIKNSDVFESTLFSSNTANFYGSFVGRYAGVLGNSLAVSVCANTSAFSTWTYKSLFTSAPGTSDYVTAAGGTNDEMHIVVVDADGLFTGAQGSVLETYGFVSKAADAALNGSTNYYKQVIFNQSRYVYATDPVDYSNTALNWGRTANTNFVSTNSNITVNLAGGSDTVPTDGNLQSSYDLFANKDVIDISLILSGGASPAVQQYIIDNIANSRKDCVAFLSPPSSAVVNNLNNEVSGIQTYLTALARSSSYAVVDSGWKYMYDKYNNVYRYIPLNGDIAGLCVNTDTIRDPWFSPAGLNRGQIKNAIKLSWNPNKTQRDVLYSAGVNPVVSFPGQGIILFGDKTLQSKPSAFDRINVRRLFIVLEKAIARAAEFSLFEFNDEFTRAQFVALVTPYLRDVQGRRGITDFRVVCDTTNNTPQVIDTNRFVGDIYIKPARSINYIQLNFVAVGTGVDFATIVGAV
jgi:hypothetical protein